MNASVNTRLAPTPAKRRNVMAKVSALAVALSLGACATVGSYEKDVIEKAEKQMKGPSQAPVSTQTSFASALRCMDIMFMNYGVRDLGVLVEDIPDTTRKVKAGPKDMIISAVSQMSRRSRGIRLVAFSINDQTLGAVVGFGTRDKVIEDTPDFTIRGSVSQFDEAIVRKQGDVGVGIGKFSAGLAKQGSGSVLALDMSMINTNELTLVPGVISKNSVLVYKQGTGADGEVNTRKFGLNFSFVLAKSEGTAQALRTLAELATIELFGKLTKVPYWTCLGATDDEPTVMTELTDWWETMAAEPVSLIAYFQQQMFARGLYTGDVTGEVDDALLNAIGVYQQAMGLEATPNLDFNFFKTYLRTNHAETQKRAKAILEGSPVPVASAAVQPADVAPATDTGVQVASVQPQPLTTAPANTTNTAMATAAPSANPTPFVYIANTHGKNVAHSRGQPYQVDVAIDKDAYLYCYLLDENRRVNQFFPNPAQPNAAVSAGTRIKFPGDFPFRLVASPRGSKESIACFAALKPLGGEPLKALPAVENTDQLSASFRRIAGPNVGVGVYDVQIQ